MGYLDEVACRGEIGSEEVVYLPREVDSEFGPKERSIRILKRACETMSRSPRGGGESRKWEGAALSASCSSVVACTWTKLCQF